MFARLMHSTGDPAKLGALERFVTAAVQPSLQRESGSMGLTLWVDPHAGAAVMASVWASASDLAASETTEAPLRHKAAGILGGAASVESYDAALVDALRPVRSGDVMRLLRMQARPDTIYDHVAWARREVIPVLRTLPGYHGYFCGVDPSGGRAIAMSTYEDRTDADIALLTTSTLHSAATDRGIAMGVMREYEVAFAGICISLPPLPAQRVELPRVESVFWAPAAG